MTRLRSLELRGDQMTDALVAKLAKLQTLECLKLPWCGAIRGHGVAALGKRLTRLYLRGCQIDAQSLSEIGSMTNLQALSLSGAPSLQPVDFLHLRTLTKLVSLNIDSKIFDEVSAAILEGMSQLRTLDLEGSAINSAGLSFLRNHALLQTLSLAKCRKVGDIGLEHIATIEGLEALDLSTTGITDVGVQKLSKLQRLRLIRLNDTRVSTKGLKALQSLPIVFLYLERCPNLRSDCFDVMKQMPTLNSVFIEDSDGIEEVPTDKSHFRLWDGSEEEVNEDLSEKGRGPVVLPPPPEPADPPENHDS